MDIKMNKMSYLSAGISLLYIFCCSLISAKGSNDDNFFTGELEDYYIQSPAEKTIKENNFGELRRFSENPGLDPIEMQNNYAILRGPVNPGPSIGELSPVGDGLWVLLIGVIVYGLVKRKQLKSNYWPPLKPELTKSKTNEIK